MSLTLVRCNKCGRVFPHYTRASNVWVACPNTKVCANKIWLDAESIIGVKFGTEFKPERNTGYIHINAFNNNAFLAARIYSEDAGNFMTIPVNERMIGGTLTRRDTLASIPVEKKFTTTCDGLIITSGCYPVSTEMESEIRKHIGEVKNDIGSGSCNES